MPKLKSVQKGIVLGSKPSIELWFLLHYRNQRADMVEKPMDYKYQVLKSSLGGGIE